MSLGVSLMAFFVIIRVLFRYADNTLELCSRKNIEI